MDNLWLKTIIFLEKLEKLHCNQEIPIHIHYTRMSNMGCEINNAEVVNGKCLSTKTIFKPITVVPIFKTIC